MVHCLEKDPARRPATVADWVRTIGTVGTGQVATPAVVAAPASAPRTVLEATMRLEESDRVPSQPIATSGPVSAAETAISGISGPTSGPRGSAGLLAAPAPGTRLSNAAIAAGLIALASGAVVVAYLVSGQSAPGPAGEPEATREVTAASAIVTPPIEPAIAVQVDQVENTSASATVAPAVAPQKPQTTGTPAATGAPRPSSEQTTTARPPTTASTSTTKSKSDPFGRSPK